MLVISCDRDKKSVAASPPRTADAGVAATYSGGTISQADLEREARKLPPGLKEQFLSPAGQRELARSLVDKRLLVDEAKRRGLSDRPDIKRQLVELEERLTVQALLAEEERAAAPPSEAELKAYYEQHRDEFAEPARVRVGRVLIRGDAMQRALRERAERAAARLRNGEALTRVALAGDGPEKHKGGELGWVAQNETPESRAALALRKSGEVAVVQILEGWSVLVLLERQEGRIPPFEEIRPVVAGKLEPSRQRQIFERLLGRLRTGADVQVAVSP